MGAMLAQQLVAVGEHVVDVPPKLSARVRLLERGRIDKTDPNDARSAAIVAWRTPALNVVTACDEHRVVLRLLADRDHQITAQRTRSICRLHALLCLLIEGGTGRSLTVARAERTPGQRAHRRADHDRADRRSTATARRDPRPRHGTRRGPPTSRHSDRGVEDDGHRGLRDRTVDGRDHHRPSRRRPPLPDRRALRPAQRDRTDRSIVGTRRQRHRLNPRGDRQLNHAIHMAAVTQVRNDTPGPRLLPPQASRGEVTQRSDARPQASHQRRRLPTPHRRHPSLTADVERVTDDHEVGSGGQREDVSESSVTGIAPHLTRLFGTVTPEPDNTLTTPAAARRRPPPRAPNPPNKHP